jgi:hypothetical protein
MLLCVLLAGCLTAKSNEKMADAKCADDLCNSLSGTEMDLCLANAAKTCSNPTLCKRILEKEREYRCSQGFGEYDALVCAGMENKSMKRECYHNAAEKLKDASLCDKIDRQDGADMCRANIAYKSGDRKVCNPVTTPSRRDFCFAVADKDGTVCSELGNEELRLTCVKWTMKKLGN